MASRSKYSEVVQAGMAVLDANMPGWECRIDPETLNLASCQLCVLGQVYGEYSAGKREVGIEDGDNYGFSTRDDSSREYGFLTRTWLRVIKKRLTAKLNKITKRGVK